MTGLEKMTNQILTQAKMTAEEKVRAANQQAQEILESAKAQAKKSTEDVSKRSQADIARQQDKNRSSIDMQKRLRVLAAKQEVIAEVLEDAYAKLTSMEDEEYFAMLLKILDKHVLAQEGEIFFSEKDRRKMPADFLDKVKEMARKKGGSLAVSEEGRAVENGFILVYGGIEENCTLRAMFDAKKDELSDIIHRLLFV